MAATPPSSPKYDRFVAAQRRPRGPEGAPASGAVGDPLVVPRGDLGELVPEAARRAAGLFRPTRRTEVVWVEGDSALAVGLDPRVETGEGMVIVTLPVRCDQTGPDEVHVTFAVGAPGRPAGLYAATERRPRGPQLVVETWGEALVAFAWRILLDLAAGLAGAAGKDARGNRLVPVELEATGEGLAIVPMARHRFAGSPGIGRAVR